MSATTFANAPAAPAHVAAGASPASYADAPQNSAPTANTADIMMCACCTTKKRSANSTTCSKRCEWFLSNRCAQCGRGRRADMPFCSKACASHSVHANWCPTCTVRQTCAGKQHCSDECASVSDHVIQRPRKKTDSTAHALLRPDDREAVALNNMFKNENVLGIVRIAPNAYRRRQYLNHRAAVEERMAANHSPKYGYGGEGNEHKRYCPLALTCSMQANADGSIYPCNDPACECCQVIHGGFSMQRVGALSHYVMASGAVAASWAEPSPACGLRAVGVARCITGNAQIIKSTEEINEPWLNGFDSCVISEGDPTFDGTYFFSDDSIEALFVVLIM